MRAARKEFHTAVIWRGASMIRCRFLEALLQYIVWKKLYRTARPVCWLPPCRNLRNSEKSISPDPSTSKYPNNDLMSSSLKPRPYKGTRLDYVGTIWGSRSLFFRLPNSVACSERVNEIRNNHALVYVHFSCYFGSGYLSVSRGTQTQHHRHNVHQHQPMLEPSKATS